MTKTAQSIKEAIALELSKEGKTLADLESALSTPLTEKSASGDLYSFIKGLEIFKTLGNIGAGTAVGLGGLAGAGAYGGYLANEDSTNQQLKRMKEIQQYQNATNTIKEDMNNPITL